MIRTPQRAVFEAFIPLIGFFWWSWSFAFIVFFVVLDLMVRELSLHLSARKINQTQGGSKESWKKLGSFSSLLIFTTALGYLLLLAVLQEGFSFSAEIWSFLTYTEMGIQQGWVLIPILILSVYASYKLEFLRFEFHKKVSQSSWWKPQIQTAFGQIIAMVIAWLVYPFGELYAVLWVAATPLFIQKTLDFLSKRSSKPNGQSQ